MGIKFIITQYVPDYVIVGENHQAIEAEVRYECSTYDDLQNWFLTQVECSVTDLKIRIHKEEVAD